MVITSRYEGLDEPNPSTVLHINETSYDFIFYLNVKIK